MEIKTLSKDVISSIRSEFKITTIPHCVYELVLNSLDAEPTAIAIRINLSSFRIQIVDNGGGITRQNLKHVGERYMTTKCHSLSDYRKNLRFYGYKGESLASIINQSKKMTISTRIPDARTTYSKIFEKGNFEIIEVDDRPSQGTTVTIEGFLYNSPVRQNRVKELDLDEIKRALEELSIIHPKIFFSLRNDVNMKMIYKNLRADTVENALINAFPNIVKSEIIQIKVSKSKYSVSALIYKRIVNNNKIQFIFVNKRPIYNPELQKIIHEVMKSSQKQMKKDSYFAYVLSIKCPYSHVDFVIEPKRNLVHFKNEELMQKIVKKVFTKFLENENLSICRKDVKETGKKRKRHSQMHLSDINGVYRSKLLKKEEPIEICPKKIKKSLTPLVKEKQGFDFHIFKFPKVSKPNKLKNMKEKDEFEQNLRLGKEVIESFPQEEHFVNFVQEEHAPRNAVVQENSENIEVNNSYLEAPILDFQFLKNQEVASDEFLGKAMVMDKFLKSTEINWSNSSLEEINEKTVSVSVKIKKKKMKKNRKTVEEFISGLSVADCKKRIAKNKKRKHLKSRDHPKHRSLISKCVRTTNIQNQKNNEQDFTFAHELTNLYEENQDANFSKYFCKSVVETVTQKSSLVHRRVLEIGNSKFLKQRFISNKAYGHFEFGEKDFEEKFPNSLLPTYDSHNIYKSLRNKEALQNLENNFQMTKENENIFKTGGGLDEILNSKLSNHINVNEDLRCIKFEESRKSHKPFIHHNSENFLDFFCNDQNQKIFPTTEPKLVKGKQKTGDVEFSKFLHFYNQSRPEDFSKITERKTLNANENFEDEMPIIGSKQFLQKLSLNQNIDDFTCHSKLFNEEFKENVAHQTFFLDEVEKMDQKQFLESKERKLPCLDNFEEDNNEVFKHNKRNEREYIDYMENIIFGEKGKIDQNQYPRKLDCLDDFKDNNNATKMNKWNGYMQQETLFFKKNKENNSRSNYMENQEANELHQTFFFGEMGKMDQNQHEKSKQRQFTDLDDFQEDGREMMNINKRKYLKPCKTSFFGKVRASRSKENNYVENKERIPSCFKNLEVPKIWESNDLFPHHPAFLEDIEENKHNEKRSWPNHFENYNENFARHNSNRPRELLHHQTFFLNDIEQSKFDRNQRAENAERKSTCFKRNSDEDFSFGAVGKKGSNKNRSSTIVDRNKMYYGDFKENYPEATKKLEMCESAIFSPRRLGECASNTHQFRENAEVFDPFVRNFEYSTNPKIRPRYDSTNFPIDGAAYPNIDMFDQFSRRPNFAVPKINVLSNILIRKPYENEESENSITKRKSGNGGHNNFTASKENLLFPRKSSFRKYPMEFIKEKQPKPQHFLQNKSNFPFTTESKFNPKLKPISKFYSDPFPNSNSFKSYAKENINDHFRINYFYTPNALIAQRFEEFSKLENNYEPFDSVYDQNIKIKSNLFDEFNFDLMERKSNKENLNDITISSCRNMIHKCSSCPSIIEETSRSSNFYNVFNETKDTSEIQENLLEFNKEGNFDNIVEKNNEENFGDLNLNSEDVEVEQAYKNKHEIFDLPFSKNKISEEFSNKQSYTILNDYEKEILIGKQQKNSEVVLSTKNSSNFDLVDFQNKVTGNPNKFSENLFDCNVEVLASQKQKCETNFGEFQVVPNPNLDLLCQMIDKIADSDMVISVSDDDEWKFKKGNVGFLNENVECRINSESDDKFEEEWIKNLDCYVNLRTGMTMLTSPKKSKNYDLQHRLSFIPKGLSQSLKKITPLDLLPLSLNTKENFYKAVVECYEDELKTIKWKNILHNTEPKKFFAAIYNNKKKSLSNAIDVTKHRFARIFVKSFQNYEDLRFNRDIFKTLIVIGQLDNKFIVTFARDKNMIILFDQHAVHERIRVEKLFNEYVTKDFDGFKFARRKLEKELNLVFNENDLRLLDNFQTIFENLGIIYQIIGNNLVVLEVSLCVYNKFKKDHDIEKLKKLINNIVCETLDILRSTHGILCQVPFTLQDLINMEACRGSIMFGDVITKEEAMKYIDELSNCKLPFQCAHGRPTLAPIIELINTPIHARKLNFKSLKNYV